ncbi:hypothetical protein Ari01nite_93340 [Paractinoplanes rishiriensis]|uniref:Uncharacterized protein n=1 Tax=Paractinoplanes rishiriensis TaxID=1050105 RepID=A0A919KAR4_9ACTN|nr:hypothetical protein Ari01nite_93340 [Actinoplanes rishiriensis]
MILLPETRNSGAGPVGAGVVVAVGDGLALVGLAVGVLTEPVHMVPLSENDAGTGFAPLHAPPNPIEVDAPVPSDPFQRMLAAETRAPDCVQVALQPWVTRWLAFGKSNARVQLDIASPRLVIATLAVNPLVHWLCTVYVTEQPDAAAEAGRVAVAKPPSTSTPAAPAASSA